MNTTLIMDPNFEKIVSKRVWKVEEEEKLEKSKKENHKDFLSVIYSMSSLSKRRIRAIEKEVQADLDLIREYSEDQRSRKKYFMITLIITFVLYITNGIFPAIIPIGILFYQLKGIRKLNVQIKVLQNKLDD